jgi:hypothetical protein
MPKYIKNTYKDIDFLSDEGVHEYLEDELSNLPPAVMKCKSAELLFSCMRERNTYKEMQERARNIDWNLEPYELQALAVCLKLR